MSNNQAVLIGNHTYRIDLLKTNRVLMFVDIAYGRVTYCVRVLVNGMIPQGSEHFMGWFDDYDAAYCTFDVLNTRPEREAEIRNILIHAGELHDKA